MRGGRIYADFLRIFDDNLVEGVINAIVLFDELIKQYSREMNVPTCAAGTRKRERH